MGQAAVPCAKDTPVLHPQPSPFQQLYPFPNWLSRLDPNHPTLHYSTAWTILYPLSSSYPGVGWGLVRRPQALPCPIAPLQRWHFQAQERETQRLLDTYKLFYRNFLSLVLGWCLLAF